jgi:hypothetical protein
MNQNFEQNNKNPIPRANIIFFGALLGKVSRLGYSKDFVAKEKAFQRSDCSMEEIRAHKDLADLIRGSRAPELLR